MTPTVRALPMRLPTVQGESLPSYVDRLAARYRVSRGVMIDRLGLRGDRHLPVGYGVDLPPAAVKAFTATTGVAADVLRLMLLTRYSNTIDFGGYSLSAPVWKRAVVFSRDWVYRTGSHYCPHCLTEDDGAWQLAWRLPWSFLCECHQAMLADHCPECLERSGLTGPRSQAGLLRQIPEPTRCANPVIRTGDRQAHPCGGRLDSVESVDASDSAEMLLLQRRITQAHDRPTSLVLGEEVPTHAYFADLRAVSRVVRYLGAGSDLPDWLPRDVREAFLEDEAARRSAQPSRREQSKAAPESALLMAAYLSIAEPVVSAPTITQAAEPLSGILERIASQGDRRKLWLVPQFCRFSDRLRRVWDQARSPVLVKTSPGAMRRRITPDGGISFPADAVPQMIWQPVFDAYFRDLLPPMRRDIYPRVISITLLRSAIDCSFAEALEMLGDATLARKTANAVYQELERLGCTERFSARVQACGAALAASHHRIDYRAREVAFGEPLVFDPGVLEAACVESRVRPMSQVLLAAGLWVWGELTGASPRLAPGADRVDAYGRFSRLVLPRLEARLRGVARHVLHTSSVYDRDLGLTADEGEAICRTMAQSRPQTARTASRSR